MTFPGVDVIVKLTGVVSRAPKSSGSIVMSQHRKNSVRDKVVDKEWFIRIGHL